MERHKPPLTSKLIEDYDLFKLAVPHHDEMQALVGTTIGKEANRAERALCVLEAGSGTGITTRLLLEADGKVHVRAFDIEDGMAAQTRSRLAAYRDRLDVSTGDIAELVTLESAGAFDVFASAFTLHHVDAHRLPLLFKEINRVLLPGGLFVNADKIARDNESLHRWDLQEQLSAFSVFATMGRDDLQREWTSHYLADDVARLNEQSHKQLLAEAGFVDVNTIWRMGMEAVIVARKPR